MLLDTLKAIVGEHGWTQDAERMAPHLREWRDAVTGRSPILLQPDTTGQVAEIVRNCAAAGVALVPQGGNTGLCGGAIPDQSGEQIVLSLARLCAIRSIDPEDFSMIVEAGCVLAEVQEAALAAQRYFPLSLSAEGSCQIGGNLSTNAGGINVIRYGNAAAQVLGLEVVLADGRIWRGLRSLRKDNAGYDLKSLFIGSEGTLGIITAACLRLYPLPRDVQTAMLAVPDPAAAVALLSRLREALGDRIQAFELISRRCFELVQRHVMQNMSWHADAHPWYVLLDVESDGSSVALQKALADAVSAEQVVDAIIAKNSDEAERFWRARHAISAAQKPEGACLKHDVSVAVARVPAMLEQGERLMDERLPGARLVAFGHVGDGNIHFDVLQPADADAGTFAANGAAFTEAFYSLVVDLGGSFSAEHGIGVFKKSALRQFRDQVDLDLMRALKKALDPSDTLNPGKVI